MAEKPCLRLLSFQEAFDLLLVNFETGRLFWKPRPVELFPEQRTCNSWNAQFAGTEALTANEGRGYRRGSILGRSYLAHRVIWLLAHGEWPPDKIDHINGVKHDNRLLNLRPVSNVENSRNKKKPSNNKSGVLGVYWKTSDSVWVAKIICEGKAVYLGRFADFDKAVSARKAAEIRFGFHPNHGRIR